MNQSALFELLRTRGVSSKTLHRVRNWSDAKLFDLLKSIDATIGEPTPRTRGPFNFVANDSLSGRRVPFSTQATRIRNVTQLARFAALYADTLLIRDPFESYPLLPEVARDASGSVHEVAPGLLPIDFAKPALRQRFVDDLALILFLRPLFFAGVVDFCKSTQHYCPSCVRAASDSGELLRFVGEPEEAAWQRRIAKLVKRIENLFLKEGRALVHEHGDHSHVTVFLPPGELEYDQMQLAVHLPRHLAKKASEPIPLRLRDARKLQVFADEIERIIDDISTQNAAAIRFDCQYITDRSLDLELMDIVSEPNARAFNRAASAALSHPVGFIDNVPLERLLKIRSSDGEAFLVYRDTVRRILSTATGKTAKELREAFEDEIRPELNRIDLVLKNSRRSTAISALKDVAVIAAVVSVAAFSGLLPSGIVPPEILNVGAALGGWEGIKGLTSKVAKLGETPREVTENRFAFLWKVKRQGSAS